MANDPVERVFCLVMGPFLCKACITNFSPVSSPYCTQCGRAFQNRSGSSHQCGDCIKKKPFYTHARSMGMYDGTLLAVIHTFKYKHKIQLAGPLGRLLFSAFLKYDEIQNIDYVSPIPLHVSRLKNRGFNQAFLLIREWPDLIRAVHDAGNGENERPSIQINCKSLIRKTKTTSQTGLGKDQRAQNVKNAFQVAEPSLISGKRILLVDDVYTTGATAEECAKTLTASGAASVNVLTLARTD